MQAGTRIRRTDHRVDGDCDRQGEADLLQLHDIRAQETGEHRDHDGGRRGDGPGSPLQALGDGGGIVVGALPGLLHTPDEENLVVHGQSEQDGEDQHGQEDLEEAGAVETQHGLADTVLEDGDRNAQGRTGGQQIQQDRLERQHDRAESHRQEDQRGRQDQGDDPREAT